MSKIIKSENTRIEKCKYCSLVFFEPREGAEPRCCEKAQDAWRTSKIVDMAAFEHMAMGLLGYKS